MVIGFYKFRIELVPPALDLIELTNPEIYLSRSAIHLIAESAAIGRFWYRYLIRLYLVGLRARFGFDTALLV